MSVRWGYLLPLRVAVGGQGGGRVSACPARDWHSLCLPPPFLVLSPPLWADDGTLSQWSPLSRTDSSTGVRTADVLLSASSGVCASFILRTVLTVAPLWSSHSSSPNPWPPPQLRPAPPRTRLPASCPPLVRPNSHPVTSLIFLK